MHPTMVATFTLSSGRLIGRAVVVTGQQFAIEGVSHLGKSRGKLGNGRAVYPTLLALKKVRTLPVATRRMAAHRFTASLSHALRFISSEGCLPLLASARVVEFGGKRASGGMPSTWSPARA